MASLHEAIATTNALPPELIAPWYFPMGEWLGWIERGRGNATDGEAAFRADLARMPNNARASDARELAAPIVKHWRGTMHDLRIKDGSLGGSRAQIGNVRATSPSSWSAIMR